MYADGSVYDNVDIENTSKELDHGLLHLSVSSYEEGYLTTYYFFICSHTFNISSTIFVVCYISCNLRTFFYSFWSGKQDF